MRKFLISVAALWGCAASVVFAEPALQAAVTAATAGQVIFAAGGVTLQRGTDSTQSVGKNTALAQGDQIVTDATGYAYVRMADNALLVLRPNSSLVIERWKYDANEPQASQIKYFLARGVARYASGKGSQAAKDQFRFNTPMAAIGVRGTDFTVRAAAQSTYVTVAQGGVVVGKFNQACRADALGPCEGPGVTELFARYGKKMVEVTWEQPQPRLLDWSPKGEGAEMQKAGPQEPQARQGAGNNSYANAPLAEQDLPLTAAAPALAPITGWGRWGAQSSDKAMLDELLQSRSLLAVNKHYVLALNRNAPMELPHQGSATFKLQSHDGLLLNPSTQALEPTQASNAVLAVNFADRTFTTRMDLASEHVKTSVGAHGIFNAQGVMNSNPFTSPASLSGVIGGHQGSQASYIYHRPASPHAVEVTGVSNWAK